MNKINLKPLGKRVLIEPIPIEDKTKGGIIIPSTAKEKPLKGVVITIGDGKKDEPLTVKKDDIVFYDKYSNTTEINIDGKDYLIMNEDDIIAILN